MLKGAIADVRGRPKVFSRILMEETKMETHISKGTDNSHVSTASSSEGGNKDRPTPVLYWNEGDAK